MLVASVAAWALLSGTVNLLDYEGGKAAVAQAMSMSLATGATATWRAIENPLLINLGYIFIWTIKYIAGALCAVSAANLWKNRNSSSFNDSKELGLCGIGLAMFMLFFGFIVLSDTYFELWRDAGFGNAVTTKSLLYFSYIGIIGLFIAQPD